ncbi:unnamed protein product [Durusdinium trenchii]|uniref:N-acetyltransferase ESCO acetyl-transferase domain-containing protein n=2 Tax=Durusdinium trenchii TaxID=1381693 RepID=A0ABP0N8A1_9DINO
MLSTSSRKKPRASIHKAVRGGLVEEKKASQRLLAVTRVCRDCGVRLSPLEDALHHCAVSFDWPFPVETLSTSSSSLGPCRLVRLKANQLRGAARKQLTELWEVVRDRELSHSLELPSIEALASQSAWLLLALKGREVLGMLSAERITTEIVEPETPTCYKRPRNAKTSDQEIVEAKMAGHEGRRSLVPSIFADENHELREAPAPSSALTVTPKKAPKRCAAPPSLGVALVWVRRRERRRGLATALVDCLRRLNGGATVAFSQPTDLGFAFATRYSRQQRFDSPMVYDPAWTD